MSGTIAARTFTLSLPRQFSMAGSLNSQTAVHDPSNRQFYLHIGNDKAVLQYECIGADTLDMYHTEVPESFRGKGVAKILAKAAFDHVLKNQLKMKLTCTYLQKYYNENASPEYKGRIVY